MMKPAPQPGQIEDGYRFKGGSPADQAAWEPVHGKDYLSTLPAERASQVQALADGRLPFPTGAALKTPYWQQMLGHVAHFDPTFDAVNYGSRAATRKSFTAGKDSDEIKSLNTAIGHMSDLQEASRGLGNYGGREPGPLGIPMGPLAKTNNSLAHFIAKQSGTGERYTRFDLSANAVADELTKVFKGSGAAESQVQAWRRSLDETGSPEELNTAVKTAAHLLNSRLQAVGEKYSQGMGTTHDPMQLLAPDKAAAFARMMGGGAAGTGGAPAATAKRPPLSSIFGGQ